MAGLPLTYKRITERDAPELAALQLLYETAFPVCERRGIQQLRSLLSEPAMQCWAVLQGSVFAGFSVSWQLPGFCFLEHLAVVSSLRGSGIGGRMLQRLLHEASPGMVLEVERPTNEASRNRVLFYQRLGFTLHTEYDYYQPPYRKGEPPVPLFLMSSWPLELPSERDRVTQCIREEVFERFYT